MNLMVNDLLQSLKTAAAGATPGKWEAKDGVYPDRSWVDGPTIPDVSAAAIFLRGDAEYIALCSPENILALVQALEEARGLAELANIVSVWMHTSGLRLPAQVDEDSYKLGEKARAFLEKYFKSEDRE